MPKEESDRRNVDALIQEPHRKGMPEAMKGDMLVDTGCLDELRDLVVQDWCGQGREDRSLFLIVPRAATASLERGRRTLYPVFWMVKLK